MLESRASPVPWHDGSLSDLSLTGEELAAGGSPGDSGSALSTQSTEFVEGLSERVPKASGHRDGGSTPRRGLGARLQQLLTPSRRRSSVSRLPPPELPHDLPPPAHRSPMDGLLHPRERPGSTASEVASKGKVQTLKHPEAGGEGLLLMGRSPRGPRGVVEVSVLGEEERGPADRAFSCVVELSLSGQ